MRRPIFSSEVYLLNPSDLSELKTTENIDVSGVKEEVVILIGQNKTIEEKQSEDVLIKGAQIVRKAQSENAPFIPVRFAFFPGNKRFDFLSPLIRKLRYKIRFYGSNVYHIDPHYIRGLKIERTIKTRENAYSFTNPKYRMTAQERDDEYSRIFNSIKDNGFSDDEPIDIMLCRLTGAKDCVNNGHHRLGISLELGLKEIPVRFSAAGAAPRLLRPLLKTFSTINLAFKRRFGH